MAKNEKMEEMIKEISRNEDELNIELRMMKVEKRRMSIIDNLHQP